MLKKRLERLEENARGNRGAALHVVYVDKEKGTMSIPSINFHGTIDEGETLMDSDNYEECLFVVFNMPDRAESRLK